MTVADVTKKSEPRTAVILTNDHKSTALLIYRPNHCRKSTKSTVTKVLLKNLLFDYQTCGDIRLLLLRRIETLNNFFKKNWWNKMLAQSEIAETVKFEKNNFKITVVLCGWVSEWRGREVFFRQDIAGADLGFFKGGGVGDYSLSDQQNI